MKTTYMLYPGSDFHPQIVYISTNGQGIQGWGEPSYQTEDWATFLMHYQKLPQAWTKITATPGCPLSQLRAVKESLIITPKTQEDVDTEDKAVTP